jgi:DNA mismatch repair protein MutL
VDQHAAHERIRYDQIMAQRKTGLASQEFLEPVIVTLTPVDHAKLPELLPLFHEMGFILESFGGDSIKITGVPIILGHGEHPSVVQNIISTTLENESYERAVDCIAKKMACHSSIRAGTPLTPERGVDLLRQLAQTREPRTCPHGRPIMIHFSGQKLAHFFERT